MVNILVETCSTGLGQVIHTTNYHSIIKYAIQAFRSLLQPRKACSAFLRETAGGRAHGGRHQSKQGGFFEDLKGKYKDIFAIYRTSASGVVRTSNSLQASLTKYYDPIGTTACTNKGITITNAPDSVTDATTDLAIFLLGS